MMAKKLVGNSGNRLAKAAEGAEGRSGNCVHRAVIAVVDNSLISGEAARVTFCFG